MVRRLAPTTPPFPSLGSYFSQPHGTIGDGCNLLSPCASVSSCHRYVVPCHVQNLRFFDKGAIIAVLSKQLLLYGQWEACCVAHTVSFLIGLLSGESIEIAGCDMKDRKEAVLLCSSIDPFICPSIHLSVMSYK